MRYTLTVYREDDSTPWFEVGTDPSHPAPYLHEPGEIDAGEVDFLQGRAAIGQVNLRVIDPQTGASQAERWLTERLGIPAGEEGEGHTALIGRRALLMRDADVVLDGVVYSVTLSETFAGFALSLRDIRERERRSKLFTRTGTASVLPRGVVAGYGRLPSGGWLVPPTTPLRATFRRFTTAVGAAGYFDLSGLWRGNPLSGSRDAVAPANLVVTEAMRRACRSVSSSVEIVPGIILNDIRYPDVQVWWRPAGGGSWTIVSDVLPPAVSPHSLLLNTTQGRLAGDEDTTVEAVYSVGVSTLLGTLPSNGQQVDVMVVYVGPPSEDYPLHIETTAGQLLKDIYDGVYSDEPLGVRYDPAALAALTAPVRLRITEPVEDARRWLEEHVYRALGAAPALDPQGRVSPVRAALPDPDAVLPVIDDNSAQAIPGWEHRADNAVTVVRVTYPRDYRVPAEQDPTGEQSAGDGIASREVIVERRAPEWVIALMGEKVHEIDGSIFRALGGPDGEPVTGDVTDETGAQIALARAHETLDRWVFGGQISTCRIRAADFPGLRVGDWVIDARSWRPNYRTRQRGGQTLAQIMAIRSADPAWLDVTLVDAGPAEQPVQPPTLGTLSVADDGVVSVPVTAVPVDGEAAVYYAISATQPAPTSGLWTFLGRLAAPGTLRTPPLPAGVTVWVRARGEALGRRPSQYTTPASIVVTLTPRVFGVRLQVTDHVPAVTWQRNAAAAGVRIYYAVHDPAATPTLSASIDVAATAGAATIPAAVPSGQAVTVDVEPWTGWTGSAVTGTAGPRVRASAAVEPATTPLSLRARVVAQSPSTLTVRVAVADPVDPTRTGDATITYTQSGTGGVTPGSPQVVPAAKIRDTLDASEAAGGYVDFTVTRPAPGAGTGQVAFTAQRLGRAQATATVEVPEQTPTVYRSTECLARITGSTATQVTVQVTATAEGGGTPQVELVGVTGATLASGAAPGTKVASGSTWVFNRPAFQAGAGQAQFRATLAGATSDDDLVVIPEQGRDTVPLLMRARVLSVTGTQIVVRVAVADPFPGNAITIAYSATGGTGLAVTPSSPQTIPAGSVTANIDTTGFVDFTITRPTSGAGAGRVTFTASASGRVSDADAVDVPERSPDPVNDGPPEATITVEVNDPNFVTVRLNARRGVGPYQYRRAVGTGDGDLSSVPYTTLPSGGVTLQVKRQPDRPVFVYLQVRDSRGVESEVADYAVAPLGRGAGNIIRPTRTALPSDEVQRPTSSTTTWKILDTSLADAGLSVGETISAGGKFRGAATSATVRFRLQFLDASNAVISTHDGPAVTPANGQVLESKVEDVVIPSGTATIRTMAVAVSGSGQPTAFEWMINPGPVLLPYRHPAYQAGRDRLSDITGHIAEGVGQYDGGTVHQIFRHGEIITVLGPDAPMGICGVSFADEYEDAPVVSLRGFCCVMPSTGDRLLIQARNISATGFQSVAQILTIGIPTQYTHEFPVGNQLTAVGQTTELTLNPGGAVADAYTVAYRVSLTVFVDAKALDGGATLYVAIDTDDGTGWVERAVASYSHALPGGTFGSRSWNFESRQIVVSGLGPGSEIRLRVKALETDPYTSATFTVQGADGTGTPVRHGVTYAVATVSPSSAIPQPGDFVEWLAKAV